MLRKVFAASVILVLTVGVALADELRGAILKVEGHKITFVQRKKGEKGEEKTFTVSKNVKVVKGMFNKETKKMEAGDPIAGGLKHKMFSEISEKGVPATIVTDNDKITEIRVFGRGKGKKDQ
ncbi:MAG: hypothetical protein ACYC3I_04820 [Gemmataceae bacterium]